MSTIDVACVRRSTDLASPYQKGRVWEESSFKGVNETGKKKLPTITLVLLYTSHYCLKHF